METFALAGCLAGSLAGQVAELLGLLRSMEGLLGFLAVLEGGLDHVVSHVRRSERLADNSRPTPC